ncbi:alpha/beta fold hydrolase [Dactylosporangium sp. AC04546]|uniref:alpha/beta hydrolase n=1 Tax=Dactylosporangium sp. AC04546 TaxID=2862460 RepID=UPI001EE041A8|nr:alpha/beta hydrolase [Dactylosporangium sp. AC04546]WVK86944.1 alpha/beta fold hydrolase [Dactylosporangium sp. AC04546]
MDRVPEELRFDVSTAVGHRCVIAAWILEPPVPARALLFAIPGGTYTKDYWHLEIPGRSGYSFAERMVEAGFAVAAIDNYGTGSSTRPPNGDDAGLLPMAGANAAVATQLRSRFPRIPMIGLGHSMGAALAVMQQARNRSFDYLAILGYGYQPLAGLSEDLPDAELLAEATARFSQLPDPCPDGYFVMDRSMLRSQFHFDDVPDDVIVADDARATVLPRSALHAVAATPLGRRLASMVDVPIFQGWGERDNTPDPHRDGAYFSSCPDYTLFVLPRSGHCHNLATTRGVMWDRLVAWAGTFC